MIPVSKEPAEVTRERGGAEPCEFCKGGTRFWHLKSNNPVCPDCAKKHGATELHNWFTGKPYKTTDKLNK